MKFVGVLKDGFILNYRVNIGVELPYNDITPNREINEFLESLKSGDKAVQITIEAV